MEQWNPFGGLSLRLVPEGDETIWPGLAESRFAFEKQEGATSLALTGQIPLAALPSTGNGRVQGRILAVAGS